MKSYTIALCACLSLAAFGAQATPYYYFSAPPERAAVPLTPDDVLRQGVDQLTDFLEGAGDRSLDADEVRAFLDTEVAPYFDFDYMAKWAAGRMYRYLDTDQRAVFAAKLQDLFMTALGRNLGTYARPLPRIDIYPVRGRGMRNEATVRARVAPRDGVPIRLDFRFYRGPEGWRVFDVAANGNSAVAYYRRHFNRMVRRDGLDAVLR